MSSEIIIALDAMGGDHGPHVVVPAAINSLKRYPNLKVIFVGLESAINAHLKMNHGHKFSSRYEIVHTDEWVEMDEQPALALRQKKNSSMRLAINAIKDGKAHACVSAGNTGALMAMSRYVLKMYDNIDRPAITTLMPSYGMRTRMLDIGANVDIGPEQLLQFARMGTVLVRAVERKERPLVGILNIGAEEIKGNALVKKASQLLREADDINFYGSVEGDDISKGVVDLVVCEGFVGNVAIKVTEECATLFSKYLKDEFNKNIFTRLIRKFANPIIERADKKISPANYNGASLLGLRGIVIKSHGGADIYAYSCAIDEAINEIEYDVPRHLEENMASFAIGPTAE